MKTGTKKERCLRWPAEQPTLARFEAIESESLAKSRGPGTPQEKWTIERGALQRLQIRRAPTDRLYAHFRPSTTRRRLPPGTTLPAGFPESSRSQTPSLKEAGKRRKPKAAPLTEGHIFLRCDTTRDRTSTRLN